MRCAMQMLFLMPDRCEAVNDQRKIWNGWDCIIRELLYVFMKSDVLPVHVIYSMRIRLFSCHVLSMYIDAS